MRTYAIFLISFFLTSCASMSAKTYSYKEKGYGYLFEKKIHNSCYVGYQKNGLLYLLFAKMDDLRSARLIIYNPKTGLYAATGYSLFHYRKVFNSCIEIYTPKYKEGARIAAQLWAISSPKFKRIFDSAFTEPEKLKLAINAEPTYFRISGEYEGEISTVSLDRNIHSERGIDGLAEELLSITDVEANKLIEEKLTPILKLRQKRKIDEERRSIVRERIKNNWKYRLTSKKSIGDKICTYDSNFFGYIEKIDGNKIKMYVIGQAYDPIIILPPGYFFAGDNHLFAYGSFRFRKMDTYRWFHMADVAHCYFGN